MTPEDLRRKRIEIDRELGRLSLRYFMQNAWNTIESNALIWGWHNDAICDHLTAVSNGEIRDLVVAIPPGTTKSLSVSTLWPAWDWVKRPTRRLIASTYAQNLSNKNAKLHRDLILSDWYQQRWGHRVRIGKDDTSMVRLFQNTAGGWRFSTSTEGEVTGRHGDIILGDDLVRAQDALGRAAIDPKAIEKSKDFWFKVLPTRRASPAHTAFVLIAQRLHHEDVVGEAIERGYTALVLPMEFDPQRKCATSFPRMQPDGSCVSVTWEDPRTEPGALLCPDRFSRAVVEMDKLVLGPQGYEAQMQQDPTPLEGLLFLNAGAKRWAAVPPYATQIITVDAAFKDTSKSDFVSIQVWASLTPNFYLIDNDTRRLNFGATCEAIREMRAKHPKVSAIYIEDKANGPAIVQTLQAEIPGVQEWSPGSDSKTSRAEAVAPLFTAGNVYLPPDDQAPWLAAYLGELRKFPMTKHDDQVDATVMALRVLHQPMVEQYAAAIRAMKKGAGR